MIDLRLEKVFRVAGNHRLAMFARLPEHHERGHGHRRKRPRADDDAAVAAGRRTAIGTTRCRFEGPSSVLTPRQLILGARWSF